MHSPGIPQEFPKDSWKLLLRFGEFEHSPFCVPQGPILNAVQTAGERQKACFVFMGNEFLPSFELLLTVSTQTSVLPLPPKSRFCQAATSATKLAAAAATLSPWCCRCLRCHQAAALANAALLPSFCHCCQAGHRLHAAFALLLPTLPLFPSSSSLLSLSLFLMPFPSLLFVD